MSEKAEQSKTCESPVWPVLTGMVCTINVWSKTQLLNVGIALDWHIPKTVREGSELNREICMLI